MRLAHRLSDGKLRLIAASGGQWADVAERAEDERLSTISGLLAAGEPTLERLRQMLRPDTSQADPGPLGPVLDRPERIFCVGRNYVDHREEFGNVASSWPEVFLRFGSSVTGPFDDVRRPSVVQRLDYEGELGVIIGRGGRHIAAGDALDHIFGYTAANDVTARDWQGRGRQWTSGKNFDGTLPIGPHIVTADEMNGEDAGLTTRVNGEVMQKARTSQFIFAIGEQIEFLSSFTELRPGDLLLTGTPGGVGEARDPQVHLVDGDVVEVEIEGIGTIRNRIVDDGLTAAVDRWRALAAEVKRPPGATPAKP